MGFRQAATETEYAVNGADPERIRRVKQNMPCHCDCGCYRDVPVKDLAKFCERFHRLSAECQGHLLKVAYETAGDDSVSMQSAPATNTGPALRTEWYLLGRRVCVQALAALLGMARRTLYKRVHGEVDGRKLALGPRDAIQARMVDQFFVEVYWSAAEHLAEDSSIKNVDRCIGEDDVAASPVNVSAPIWSPSAVVLTEADLVTSWPRRYLQHGRLTNLWWQFLAWYSALNDIVLQSSAFSVQGNIAPVHPSWSTFWRRWDDRWRAVIGFRGKLQHSQCTECVKYEAYMRKANTCAESKHAAAREWRKHLRGQYHDRLIYWHLRWFSRQRNRGVVTIIIDSMDKSKLAWPQYTFRKPKCLDSLVRPKLVVTGSIAHGYCTDIYITDDEVMSHGGSAFCEILTRTLERVSRICERAGIPMPAHLVVQSDNTTAQAKNSEVGRFLATMVARHNLRTATLNFLPVGHTHEDIDLLFGIILSTVLHRVRFQTPEELMMHLRIGLAPYVEGKLEELNVELMTHIRDFLQWMAPQNTQLYNAFKTRQGIVAPHSFAYKLRADLSLDELAAVGALPAFSVPDPDDVFCIVKRWMHDTTSLAPVLVLPVDRRDRVTSLGPTTGHARRGGNAFTVARQTELLKLADELESMTEDWGPEFSYFRAAYHIRELVTGRPPVPAPPGWLETVALPFVAPLRPSGNPYFGHLPDMVWSLLATFRN